MSEKIVCRKNYHTKRCGSYDEKVSSEKVTKPDMAYTPTEILQRNAKGLPLPKLAGLSHTGDIMVPNVKAMDLTEIDEFRTQLKNEVSELEEKRKQRMAAIKKAEKERAEFMRNKVEQQKGEPQNKAD